MEIRQRQDDDRNPFFIEWQQKIYQQFGITCL